MTTQTVAQLLQNQNHRHVNVQVFVFSVRSKQRYPFQPAQTF